MELIEIADQECIGQTNTPPVAAYFMAQRDTEPERGRENLKTNKYEIDMCNGSIMDKLISFALPLILSQIYS